MSAKFEIISPETTRNLVRNPSVEEDITDWLAQGSVITQSTAQARFGRFSVQVVTDGVALFEGVSVRSFPATSGITYTASAYIRGTGRVRLRLRDDTNGDEVISDTFSLTLDRWIRIADIIGRTGAIVSNDLRIHIETVAVQAITFFVDGVQIEEKPYSTTYIDGDQLGGRWNIQRHLSVSDRLSNERSGGRPIVLDEESIGLYSTMTGGIGMPSVRHNVQGRALEPGVEFQSTKVLPRTIILTIWIKNPTDCPDALGMIHEVRQKLVDLIKPDRLIPDQPFTLIYNGGSVPMQIEAFYEGGLEFEGDTRNPFFNSFVVRFLATDPFWVEDNQHVAILDPIDVLPIQNGLIAKINREWNDLGLVNNRIIGSAIGPDGNLYVTADFTVIGGVGANGIAFYDGTNWNPLGAGLNVVGGAGLNIAFGPDGSLYVAGSFLDAGGIANTRGIARWDFGTATWNAVGGGLDDSAFSMSFAPDGSFYITGNFINADPTGAPVTVNRVARFVNGAWEALIDTGAGLGNGFDAGGLEIAVAPDGRVYVGGAFTLAGGVAAQHMARWDPADSTWNNIGDAAPLGVGFVTALAVAPDGTVFAGGDFTSIGGVTADRAASWNGTAWSALAGGVDDNVRWIFIDETGLIWYVGDFTEAEDPNSIAIPNTRMVAIWDGTQWIPPQFTVPANLLRMRTVTISGEDLHFGGEGTVVGNVGDAFISVLNPDIDSLSTAEIFPTFHFQRTGGTNAVIILLLNEDSRKQMKLTYEMADGEEVTIDLRPRVRTIESSLFAVNIDVASALRNRLGELVPGSDFATWSLLPGENDISVYVQPVGGVTIDASMRWQPRHWSADAVES